MPLSWWTRRLLTPATTDDQEFTGYRPDAQGVFHLSYGFRNTPGYRFQNLEGGPGVLLAAGPQRGRSHHQRPQERRPLAELSPPAAGAAAAYEQATTCPAGILDPYVALWINGEPAAARAVFDAFIRDLAAIHRENKFPVIVATRNIKAGCPALDDKRSALIAAIRAQIEGAGLRFVDLDAREVAAVGVQRDADLYGFGANLGIGHLNVAGNRVYGEIFADAIAHALPR